MVPEPPPPPPAPPSPAAFAPYHHHHHHRIPDSSAPIAREYAYTQQDEDGGERQPYALRAVERGSKGSSRSHAHDSVMSHPLSSPRLSPPSPSPRSSLSSGPTKHTSLHEIQHAAAAPAVNAEPPFSAPPPRPRARLADPEKAAGCSSPHSPRAQSRVSATHPDVTAVVYDTDEYHDSKGPEDKAVQLLLFLSLPCALLSLLLTLWTLVALLFTLLLQPLRLFTPHPRSLAAQLTAFLAPPLNLQLRLIYSYHPTSSSNSNSDSATGYSAPMLLVVHLLSPFVALGVAIAAWTAAFFWFFSAILGDPAGQDGRNDGKESILGVRGWWERWLVRGLR